MTTSHTARRTFDAGDRVRGTYLGVPFEGIVDSTTINWEDLRLTFLTLTAPMGGDFADRTSLCVTTAFDGSFLVDGRGYDSGCSVELVEHFLATSTADHA